MSGNHYENTLNLPGAAESFTANSAWLPVSHCCINDDNALCYSFSTRSPLPLGVGSPWQPHGSCYMWGAVGSKGWDWTEEGERVRSLCKLITTSAPAAAFCAHCRASPGAFKRQHFLFTSFNWGLESQKRSACREEAMSLFPRCSTDRSPATESLALKKPGGGCSVPWFVTCPCWQHCPAAPWWLLKVCLSFVQSVPNPGLRSSALVAFSSYSGVYSSSSTELFLHCYPADEGLSAQHWKIFPTAHWAVGTQTQQVKPFQLWKYSLLPNNNAELLSYCTSFAECVWSYRDSPTALDVHFSLQP